MKLKISKYFTSEFIFILALALFELIHLKLLFRGAEFLAGGDNYTYLQLGRVGFLPYVWDSNHIALGGINASMPGLLGIPLYSFLLSFLPAPIIQRIVIYFLYFFRYIAFVKLIKLLFKKLDYYALIPSLLFFAFNVFESLNPFSLFPLMYSVYLPFSFYYFLKLYSTEKIDYINISKLIVLSIIFTPINANIPLSVTLFYPQILYLLFFIKELTLIKIKNLGIYYLLLIATSLWWLYPLFLYYTASAQQVFSSGWFTAINVGSLANNLRLIGQWGWYEGSFMFKYYPFNKYYDNFFIIVATYTLTLLGLLGGVLIKNKKKYIFTKNYVFFVFLALFSIFIIGGSRPPFGFVYNLLYNSFSIVKVFREPFTKFGELYVISLSVLLYFSLINLKGTVLNKFKMQTFIVVLLLVLLSIKPVLIGEHVWNKWNGNMRTFRVNVPNYWLDFEKYVSQNINNSKILTIPEVKYGAAWNWPNGISSADDIALNFIGDTNDLLRNPIKSVGGNSGLVINNVFDNKNLPKNYLSILGVDYILQENDLDWRYPVPNVYTPNDNLIFAKNLQLNKIAEFGKFTDPYMSVLENNDPDINIQKSMSKALKNQPALVLYKTDPKIQKPLIYSSNYSVYSNASAQDLPKMLKGFDGNNSVSYFLNNYNVDNKKYLNEDILTNARNIYLLPNSLEYKLNINSWIWNYSWLWPQANTNPADFEFKLVLLKEKLQIFSAFDNLERVELFTWLSAKRIAELEKYKLTNLQKNKLIADFLNKTNSALIILEKIPQQNRDKAYIDSLTKFYEYTEKSFAKLAALNIDLTNNPNLPYIQQRILQAVDSVNQTTCGDYCYILTVPENGSYDFYVGDNLVESLDIKKDTALLKAINPKLLTKKLVVGELRNINNTEKAAIIKNQGSEEQYIISFDYKTNTDPFGYILIENTPEEILPNSIERSNSVQEYLDTFKYNEKNISILKKTKYCKTIINDSCYTHYEKIIQSNKNAGDVKLLFKLTSDNFDIKNLEVTEINTSLISLRKNQASKQVIRIPPLVSFKKINPTKYIVHVTNATTPYSLVFGESFDNNWRVYRSDNVNILTDKHYTVNGFANSWLISPTDVNNQTSYDLTIEFSPQRIFNIFFIIFIVVGVLTFSYLVIAYLIRIKIKYYV